MPCLTHGVIGVRQPVGLCVASTAAWIDAQREQRGDDVIGRFV
jgi:hypothetical protein